MLPPLHEHSSANSSLCLDVAVEVVKLGHLSRPLCLSLGAKCDGLVGMQRDSLALRGGSVNALREVEAFAPAP